MTHRRSTARTRWGPCLASWILVGLLAWTHLGEVSLGFSGQAELEYLKNTQIRLGPFTVESITELQVQLDRLEAQGFPTPPPPPVGWTVQATRNGSDASGRVSYHFDRNELPWVQLVNFIDQLEAHFSIHSLDIQSRGTLTHREIARVEITVAVPNETTRRQAATMFPGPGFTGPRRQDGPTPHYADRSPSPDHPAFRLRRPLRTAFRFVPSLRRSAGGDSFIQPPVSPLKPFIHDHA